MITPHIRWMIRRDLLEALEIEQGSFECPWQESDFISVLRQRNAIGMVAEHDDRIVGFMLYELHKNIIHVLNFAVCPHVRRQGVGAAMVERLAGKLSSDRRTRITLEIRETNVAAQLFFGSQGFWATGILRDFYEDTTEDAYAFRREYREPMNKHGLPVNRIRRLASN
jgi:ribosomal-protein-alanine N-acetyltransferase